MYGIGQCAGSIAHRCAQLLPIIAVLSDDLNQSAAHDSRVGHLCDRRRVLWRADTETYRNRQTGEFFDLANTLINAGNIQLGTAGNAFKRYVI